VTEQPPGTPPPYFRSLADVLLRLEVTRASGARLPFAEGFEAAVALVRERTSGGRKVIFIGNGGSAAIASHQAVDYWKNGGMRAIAFNDSSLLTCIANDYGFAEVFERPVAMFADPGDVLIAISSSGRSENIHRGTAAARAAGCAVITLSGFAPDNGLRALGDINFFVPSHSYAEVEISHLAVCHAMVDFLIARDGRAPATPGPLRP
jgi:D-sedoheptulose 7-phosphate isomerase